MGWEEWVGLPALGLPALKAKIDTGARTSALHAFDIEPYGPATRPRLRFGIHPIPGNDDVSVPCSAEIIDRRDVTSSNGERELRYVIRSELSVGRRRWPIEITLTDRGGMAYRMLLGRQALDEGVVVAPGESCLQPELGYEVYQRAQSGKRAPPRVLRVAILSHEEKSYATRRLLEEGEARGHVVDVVDTLRCYIAVDLLAPRLHCDGRLLPRFDAVIPRIGRSATAFGSAVLRHFEASGCYCVNPASGITSSRDRLQASQILARHRLDAPETVLAVAPDDVEDLLGLAGAAPFSVRLADAADGRQGIQVASKPAASAAIAAYRGLHRPFLVQKADRNAGPAFRCLIIGGRVVATIRHPDAAGERGGADAGASQRMFRITRAERLAALRAARAFKLNFAGVDLLRSSEGPRITDVTATPGLERIERLSRKNLAGALFDVIERRVRPLPENPDARAPT